jgi:hypothetical protein
MREKGAPGRALRHTRTVITGSSATAHLALRWALSAKYRHHRPVVARADFPLDGA